MPTLALGGFWVAMDRRVQRGNWDLKVAAPATPKTLSGPVLSLRRQPATLSIEVNDRKLSGALDPVTDNIDNPSCFAASLDGRLVIDDNAGTPALPASNMKIVTAAVALEVLGADHRFVTRANGTVNGDSVDDLYLVGGGDPLLRSGGYVARPRYPTYDDAVTSLEDLADQVAAKVRRVGRVVADESHFDSERYPSGWGEEVRDGEGGPLSGLLINDSRRLDDIRLPVDDPQTYAARELTRLLRDRGVEVLSEPVSGIQPGPIAELAAISSPPLTEIVKQMLTNSDNNTAEMVLKELGAAATAGQGNRPAGIAKVTETLAAWGVPMAGVSINDGSGLDRANRLTCRAIVAILDHVGTDGAFYAGLPTPGSVGTLAEDQNAVAFDGLGVDGRVHAKTGTLTGAKALSGFFDLADGRKVSFSLLVNGTGDVQGLGRIIWAQMAAALAAFSAGPTADQLAIPGT